MSKLHPNIKKLLKKGAFYIKPLSYYLAGIIERQDPFILSEAITLMESEAPKHQELAREILLHCYGAKRDTLRIGVTGSPGVGKSSFIESITPSLIKDSSKVAILTIDPSSADSLGSILGDKTRMIELTKNGSVYIRSSPSRNFLGGTNRYTYEAILMCEAAGYDRIIIETVGVGQSETDISDYTDLTMLLIAPGEGDEVQGIKKGILENTDVLIIHKADGDRMEEAERTKKDYIQSSHLRSSQVAQIFAIQCYSSITRYGVDELLSNMDAWVQQQQSTDAWDTKRHKQRMLWLEQGILRALFDKLRAQILSHPNYLTARSEVIEHPDQLIIQYLQMINALKIEVI